MPCGLMPLIDNLPDSNPHSTHYCINCKYCWIKNDKCIYCEYPICNFEEVIK